MALTKALNGFTPARRIGGAGHNGSNTYRIANGLTQNIFRGDDVKTTLGFIQRCSAVGDFAIGVFDGCYYIDPVTKKPTWSSYWTSGTSAADAAPMANVVDDPNATFFIQADASVTTGDVGLNFDLTIGDGSTITGRSGFGIKASTRGTAHKRVRVLDIKKVPGNAFGDATPVVEVKIAMNAMNRVSAGVG